MRKNLTISLDPNDWALVRASVRGTKETYSGFFRRLIQTALGKQEVDAKVTAKYRPLFAGNSEFLARRAGVFARARHLSRKPA